MLKTVVGSVAGIGLALSLVASSAGAQEARSTVYGTGYCNAGYCGLYASTENIVASGDSGGPWFYGNGAKGISNGYGPVGGATRSFFTRIGAVNLLNTVVFTG